MSVERLETFYWVFYIDHEALPALSYERVGKWMYRTYDLAEADRVCEEIVASGIVAEAKHSTRAQMLVGGHPTAVCCFYLNGDDIEAHRRVLSFMLEHGLVWRTRTGRLYDIPFKFDDQTRAGEYGASFHARITLSDFVDLATGSFIC